ncbi:hypothetical protein DAPPUDRAFT_300036 [Daphnia pulex]|uniref:Ionotropic glutamate receptor C-terminal domain-containing protein n=1 Tax=Daphnia pulex TaxID=6669 RepID=E9FS05_DAPPU|nr:hypothetical protein DAPPUDRAFT_300036 [Daphnia pulex]|eukprot:EFX89946.1 hypothetical protein DAPPUDRAFT_300036 [Daphnia pulex]
MPLLRLDFIPCPSNEAAAAPGGLEIERLELYRLNASLSWLKVLAGNSLTGTSCGWRRWNYEVEEPSDNTYGTVTANGSWNGMIGMIIEQIVDIGVGPFSVTHSRSKAIDFSVAFHEEPTAILIPPPAEDNRLAFLAIVCPSSTHSPVEGLDICMENLPESRSHSQSNLASEAKCFPGKKPGSSEAIFLYFRSSNWTMDVKSSLSLYDDLAGQKLSSIGFSPRLLGGFWCLSAVVFASAYVGILVGFLSFPRLSPIIGKLEELPGSKLGWGVHRGTALETLFTEATTGVYKTIGEGLLKQQGALVDANADGVQRVTNGSYAFIKEKSYLQFAVGEDYARSGTCRLSIAKQEFFKVNFAFALPTDSPLKHLLDKKILQLIETGLGEYWKKLYWPPSSRKCDDVNRSGGAIKSLNLTDLQGAFVILALGSGVASAIFVAERIITQSRISRIRPFI